MSSIKALGISIALAAAGFALILVYMKRFEAEVSGGGLVRVLVATEDIPLGDRIRRDAIGVRQIPQAYVDERHVRADDERDIVGVRTRAAVRSNQALLWNDLMAATTHRRALASLIPTGVRAMTIHTESTSALGGLLNPGDRVDVIFTTTERSLATKSVSLPLLQNVIVLAVGNDTGSLDEGSPVDSEARSSSVVTLGVTMPQAQALAYASSEGRLTLALRNPDDLAVLHGLPDTTRQDLLEPSRRSEVLATTRSTSAGKIEHVQ